MLTLILGLGNIGKKYRQTRHNLGFEVVDRVVEKLGAVRQEDAELYEWWKVEVGGANEGTLRPIRSAQGRPAQGDLDSRPQNDEEGLLRAKRARNDDVSSAQTDGQTGASAAHKQDEEGLLRSPEAGDTRNDEQSEAGLAMTESADSGGTDSDRGTHSKLWGTEEEERQAGRPDATKRELILAKPRTYMNGSGEAAKELIERLGITPADILVIVDDFQIPLGAIRFRPNGSDGGHNGLISVIQELGTQAFPRLRLGIGAPQDKAQVVDYVLSRFTTPEKPVVEKMLAVAAEGVIFAVQHRLEVVMSKYNFNPAPPGLT